MLKRAWGIDSYSVYDDRADIGADDRLGAAVGHRFLPAPWPAAYERMKDAAETFFVKTHDVPIDSGKAIYVVRDGRNASASFCHYLNDFPVTPRTAGGQTVGLAEVILGVTPFGSWSDHLDSWDPQTRPSTLLLKFEELIGEPQEQIERIGAFLGRPASGPWRNDFAELKRRAPRFFRAGPEATPDSGNDAMAPAETELFWLLHGSWMQRLGYSGAEGHYAASAPAHSRKSIHAAICNLQSQLRAAEGRQAEARAIGQKLSDEKQVLAAELDAARSRIEHLSADHQAALARVELLESHLQTLSRSRAMRFMSVLHLSPKLGWSEAL